MEEFWATVFRIVRTCLTSRHSISIGLNLKPLQNLNSGLADALPITILFHQSMDYFSKTFFRKLITLSHLAIVGFHLLQRFYFCLISFFLASHGHFLKLKQDRLADVLISFMTSKISQWCALGTILVVRPPVGFYYYSLFRLIDIKIYQSLNVFNVMGYNMSFKSYWPVVFLSNFLTLYVRQVGFDNFCP